MTENSIIIEKVERLRAKALKAKESADLALSKGDLASHDIELGVAYGIALAVNELEKE